MAEADEKALAYMGGEASYRITRLDDALKDSVFLPLRALEKAVQSLLEVLQDVLEAVTEDQADDIAVYETKAVMRRLASAGSLCALFGRWDENPEQVFWLSRDRTSSKEFFVTFYSTPVNISGMMREAVYAPYSSVLCTSATLTVGERFDYWESRVGLLEGLERPLLSGIFPSPFPYKTRVVLAVPTDAPMPDQEGYQSFVNKAIKSILELSGGHALCLFTNYESLRAAYEEVRPAMNAIGVACLRQGDDDRSRILSTFKTDASSVLFATDSFWEGVDAPGDACRLVVIAKLPFRVPTDPVQKARAEAIERAGGNSFMDMSLPDAAMRLKQGFGRLMRRSTDSGAVVILDSRVVKKRYGELFLRTLPETKRSIKELSGILSDLEAFLY
jgi:ATP-dependent DNA helicase DinG